MSDVDEYFESEDYREGCPECGSTGPGDPGEPDGWRSACIDDLCYGGEVPCMHGDDDRLPCSVCGR
jgi:hypothetical protein